APAPIVERAGDLVALDGAAAQVAAHVPAVGVQHVQLARRVAEDDELHPEGGDRMRLAVQVVLHRAEAVRASGKPVRQCAGVDLAYADPGVIGTHLSPPSL